MVPNYDILSCLGSLPLWTSGLLVSVLAPKDMNIIY